MFIRFSSREHLEKTHCESHLEGLINETPRLYSSLRQPDMGICHEIQSAIPLSLYEAHKGTVTVQLRAEGFILGAACGVDAPHTTN